MNKLQLLPLAEKLYYIENFTPDFIHQIQKDILGWNTLYSLLFLFYNENT